MITKAIIQKVNDYSNDSNYRCLDARTDFDGYQQDNLNDDSLTQHHIYTYDVSIPIIDGSNDVSGGGYWTEVSCITLPHMESMKYSVGDVVYVAIEDFDLNSVIILGMIPLAPQSETFSGAGDTASSISMDKVVDIKFRAKGHATLPINTTMYDEYGTDPDYVQGEDLRNTANSLDNFQQQINRNKQSINSITVSMFNSNVELYDDSAYSNTSNIAINDQIWKNNSGATSQGLYTFIASKNKADKIVFRCEKRNFNILEDGSISIEQTPIEFSTDISVDKLKTIYGINLDEDILNENSKFSIKVQMGELPVEHGGTGANTPEKARQNLGIYEDVVLSITEFNYENEKGLKPNTIYYVYDLFLDEVSDNP